jgi:hypothetical protein
MLFFEPHRFLPFITGAEYTTSLRANLLDEGIDRYLGISWRATSGVMETGILVRSRVVLQSATTDNES